MADSPLALSPAMPVVSARRGEVRSNGYLGRREDAGGTSDGARSSVVERERTPCSSSPAWDGRGGNRGDVPDWSLTPPLSMVDQLTLERDSLLRDRAELRELARVATDDRHRLVAELEQRESEIVSLRKVIAESGPAQSNLSQLIVSMEQRSHDMSCDTSAGGVAGDLTPSTPGCHGDQVFTLSTESVVDGVAAKEGEELAPPPGELAPPPGELAPPPGEVALFLVLQYLSTLELLTVSGVSRQWRRVSRHSSLWKQVEMKDVMLPAQVLEAMAGWCTQTETLKLHGLCPVPAYPDEDLQSYIQRQRACLENGLAGFFQSSGHSLRRVYITECHVMVTERALWLAGIYCPNLQEVAYSSREFSATPEAIWSLSCGSPDIRALYFPPVDGRGKEACFGDHCLRNMANGFPRLRCAAVGGPSITPVGVAQFMSDCPHLREIRLVHCFEINQSSMSMLLTATPAKLIAVSFIHTPITPRAVTLLTGTWPHLRKVVVSLSFSDYFDDINDRKSVVEFKKILERLDVLRQQSKALQVMADYS